MDKVEVLVDISLGERIAENEAEALAKYFVETDQWRKLIAGDVDVVYGPKGSGKSALYSLLRQKSSELTARGILFAAGENVRGTPVFEDFGCRSASVGRGISWLMEALFFVLDWYCFSVGEVQERTCG